MAACNSPVASPLGHHFSNERTPPAMQGVGGALPEGYDMSEYERSITEAAARLATHLAAEIDRGNVSSLGGAR